MKFIKIFSFYYIYYVYYLGMDSVTDGAWYCQLCKYVT